MLKKTGIFLLTILYIIALSGMAFHEIVHDDCDCDDMTMQDSASIDHHQEPSDCACHQHDADHNTDRQAPPAADQPSADASEHHEHSCEVCDTLVVYLETSLSFLDNAPKLITGSPLYFEFKDSSKSLLTHLPGGPIPLPADSPPSAYLEAVSSIILIV